MKVILLLVVLLSINFVQSVENNDEDYVEDDFRILTLDDDLENDGINDEMSKDFQENTKILKTKGNKIDNLPYENYGKFDELKNLPPFPNVDNTVKDEEAVREKRSLIGKKLSPYSNKMDMNIRDSPMQDDFTTNSKFHGFNVLSDFQDDKE